ncbi:MAG: MFS transporter [Paraburkholderia sp.]|uniref:MFS transporter n=1 Tax=Paraburkholderia sp. TaxID=1926495 RepID=UPI0011FCF75A|nr:MFS transporter [Paraburkholderia sp.]TAL98670.1 MAG: MFS transporter [Paraburkholderia sp.]
MQARNQRYENVLVILLFFTVGSVFFDRLSISFLFPFMRGDFALTNSRIGMLTSALALTWAISGVLLSAYADNKNRRKLVLIAAVAVFSLCSISSGLASTFGALLLARALMGLAEGPVLPVSQSLMTFASSDSRRGFNMGFIQASAVGLLGSVLAPAVIVPLASAHGWRFAFYCAGMPGLVLALLLAIYIREPAVVEKKESLLPVDQRDMPFMKVLMDRNIFICMIMSCLFITWFLAIVTFGPAYLIEQRHFSPMDMSVFMTVLGVSSVISGFAVPALSDRVGRKPTLIVFSAVAVCAPLVIGFLPGTLTTLCLAIFVAYFGYGCSAIFLATIPAESVPRYFISRAVATVIGTGEVIGGFVSPTLAGFSADTFGPTAPLLIAAGSAVLALFASLFLRETAPRKDRVPTPEAKVVNDAVVG